MCGTARVVVWKMDYSVLPCLLVSNGLRKFSKKGLGIFGWLVGGINGAQQLQMELLLTVQEQGS